VSLVGIVRDAYVGCAPDASVPMSAVRLRLFGYVVAAWRGADAQLQPRVAHARERLAVDERGIASGHRVITSTTVS
jgi:hypothetical protein